jgi:predicted deacetylase
MEKESFSQEKFCGNCDNHNTYNYPDQVFCTLRLLQNKNPIVETLWHCKEWIPSTQGCYCVQEAKKNKTKK